MMQQALKNAPYRVQYKSSAVFLTASAAQGLYLGQAHACPSSLETAHRAVSRALGPSSVRIPASPRQKEAPRSRGVELQVAERQGFRFAPRNHGSALSRSARRPKNSPQGCFLNGLRPHRFESLRAPAKKKRPGVGALNYKWRRGRDSNPGYRVHR